MKRYSVIPVVFACALGPAAGGAQNSPPSIQRGLHYTITMGGEPVGTSEVVVEPERDGRVKAQPGHPWPAPLASIPSATMRSGSFTFTACSGEAYPLMVETAGRPPRDWTGNTNGGKRHAACPRDTPVRRARAYAHPRTG